MMTEIIFQESSKEGKKYDAITDGEKTVSFGATGYGDFAQHTDEERKQRYVANYAKT